MSAVMECSSPSNNAGTDQPSPKNTSGLVRKTLDKVRAPVEKRVKKSAARLDKVVTRTGDFLALVVNVWVAAVLTVASSVFLYSTFYYTYMPLDTHEANLNFGFESCGSAVGLCSFPNATANISPRKQNLMPGWVTQRQWVRVYFYEEFVDNTHNPAKIATIQLQSKFIQVYSGQLRVAANLSGLRSVMYHHPWMSAGLGISTNILVISVLVIMSWTRLRRVGQQLGQGEGDIKSWTRRGRSGQQLGEGRVEDWEEEVSKCWDGEQRDGLDDKKERID